MKVQNFTDIGESNFARIEAIVPTNELNRALIVLPGRGQRGRSMMQISQTLGLSNTAIIGITPHQCAWYPMPQGADNQDRAVAGLSCITDVLYETILRIKQKLHLANLALFGFSAGAVVSLNLLTKPEKWKGVVAHSGAILDTNNFPVAQSKSPILLIHSKYDSCFDWDERYLPMKECLLSRNYETYVYEKEYGDHRIDIDDMPKIAKFFKNVF